MAEISRRTALRSVAATALVGLTAPLAAQVPKSHSGQKKTKHPVKPMSLDEFRQCKGPPAAEKLFNPAEGHTFMACHIDMREKHGIWIPELVPVFEKMDAMRAAIV